MFARQPEQPWVLRRRRVGRDAALVDLRVLRQARVEVAEAALVEHVDGFDREDARVLEHDLKAVLEGRDRGGVLRCVTDRLDLRLAVVQFLALVVPVEAEALPLEVLLAPRLLLLQTLVVRHEARALRPHALFYLLGCEPRQFVGRRESLLHLHVVESLPARAAAADRLPVRAPVLLRDGLLQPLQVR